MEKPNAVQSDRYVVEIERRSSDPGATRVSRETIVVMKSPGMRQMEKKQYGRNF